jgi:hypothetical protein
MTSEGIKTTRGKGSSRKTTTPEQKPRNEEQLGEGILSHTTSEHNKEQRSEENLPRGMARASDALEVDPQ